MKVKLQEIKNWSHPSFLLREAKKMKHISGGLMGTPPYDSSLHHFVLQETLTARLDNKYKYKGTYRVS